LSKPVKIFIDIKPYLMTIFLTSPLRDYVAMAFPLIVTQFPGGERKGWVIASFREEFYFEVM
jgi:hypothetical protein